jgi:hypothetical protein
VAAPMASWQAAGRADPTSLISCNATFTSAMLESSSRVLARPAVWPFPVAQHVELSRLVASAVRGSQLQRTNGAPASAGGR